jgi:hypothetical protein
MVSAWLSTALIMSAAAKEFAKSTWHPSIFGKTGKFVL